MSLGETSGGDFHFLLDGEDVFLVGEVSFFGGLFFLPSVRVSETLLALNFEVMGSPLLDFEGDLPRAISRFSSFFMMQVR